jgi:hypothetical protein
MGQYEPEDSRNVTLSNHTAPGEPERTGPREGETRQQQRQGDAPDGAQAGYGNSRTEQGTAEQDLARGNSDDAVVGETSDDPARKAQADAERPLGGA